MMDTTNISETAQRPVPNAAECDDAERLGSGTRAQDFMSTTKQPSSVACIRFVRALVMLLPCVLAGVYVCRCLAFIIAGARGVEVGNDGFISGIGAGLWLTWRASKPSRPNNALSET